MVRKVMEIDNSWNNTAGKYMEVYNSVRVQWYCIKRRPKVFCPSTQSRNLFASCEKIHWKRLKRDTLWLAMTILIRMDEFGGMELLIRILSPNPFIQSKLLTTLAYTKNLGPCWVLFLFREIFCRSLVVEHSECSCAIGMSVSTDTMSSPFTCVFCSQFLLLNDQRPNSNPSPLLRICRELEIRIPITVKSRRTERDTRGEVTKLYEKWNR